MTGLVVIDFPIVVKMMTYTNQEIDLIEGLQVEELIEVIEVIGRETMVSETEEIEVKEIISLMVIAVLDEVALIEEMVVSI